MPSRFSMNPLASSSDWPHMASPESDDADWDALVAQFGAPPSVDMVAEEVASDITHAQPMPRVGMTPETETPREERFVPPTPAPLVVPPIDRLIAWICLIGGPTLMLLCLFVNIRPPVLFTLLGLAAIVCSFIYLVFFTPRTVREGWDDGAQL
jgi:hypothetical protein